MIDIVNVKLPLDLFPDSGIRNVDAAGLRAAAAAALGVESAAVMTARIEKRSIDARKKADVHFVAVLAVELASSELEEAACERNAAKPHVPYEPLAIEPWPEGALRPLVVGTGPAGLFAAVYLARAGAKPLVVERGACVEERQRAVTAFDGGAALDPETNVQFGEGGAGTFSDGKLTNNMKNPRCKHVLRWFVDAGAPEEILWEGHPHIGSDRLPATVAALRNEVIERGGQVRFGTCLMDVELDGERVVGAVLRGPDGVEERVAVRQLVLATGHSARDVFALLKRAGFLLERKPFAMGVRIEHDQRAINRSQWGRGASHAALGAAEYKAAVHVGQGRTVHTFCMCPGGRVTCAASEESGVVVNGMSDFARDGRNANAALLVNVDPADFGGDPEDPLAGVELQRTLERRAFQVAQDAGAAPYCAPAQRVGDFLPAAAVAKAKGKGKGKAPRSAKVRPTYARGVAWCDLHTVLPPFISRALEEALPQLDRRIHGFADPQAVMTAPESRSSSPVRVVRSRQDLQAHLGGPDAPGSGVYPCGEGAGYAGGIMSAAVDGLRVAEALCRQTRA